MNGSIETNVGFIGTDESGSMYSIMGKERSNLKLIVAIIAIVLCLTAYVLFWLYFPPGLFLKMIEVIAAFFAVVVLATGIAEMSSRRKWGHHIGIPRHELPFFDPHE